MGDEFLALEKYVNLNYMVRAWRDACVYLPHAAQARALRTRITQWMDRQPLSHTFSDSCSHIDSCSQGFHKILKKHDKCLPHAPCRQFYVAHLHQQPWVQVCVANQPGLLSALMQ